MAFVRYGVFTPANSIILGVISFSTRKKTLLGYLISIFYKAWTGRIPPPFRGFPRTPIELLSRAFHHVLFDRVKWSRQQAVWPRPKLICSLR
jgi:hypothetical protein